MKQQWLKESELKAIQNKMLKVIISHAFDNVPFYRCKMKSANITPQDIRCAEDLQKFPITTKQEIRDNFPAGILSKGTDLTNCWISKTSGSTGIPLNMVYDIKAEDFQKAVALRPNLSCGQRVWDRWAVFTSPSHISPKKWFQKLGLFSPDFVSLFDPVDEQISKLRKIKPKIIDGYASSIYLLSRRILDTGDTTLSPKLIYCTSEMLTQDMRKTIESAFSVPVLDQYGCVELGRTAWECLEHSGYHIDCDAVVMEFLRDSLQVTPGERGEVTYTGLYNLSMPLIRYSIGDIAIPSDEKCPCGRGLPLMKILEGRKDAFMQTPDGRIFSPIIWTVMMRGISGIGEFRAVQEKIDCIKVILVSGPDYTPATDREIEKSIKNALGNEMNVIVQLADELPRDKSCKVRSALSNVPINW
jgi:phenylacetate-CoA ligase